MHVVIIGGGITGLATAWELQKKKINVTLVEKSDRLGGLIRTHFQDGFLCEQGPHSMRGEVPELIGELGLTVIHASAKKRFIYRDGLVEPFLTATLWKGLLRDLVKPRGNGDDETIHAFATRRFGIEMANLLFDPLTIGVFAGDSHKLSLQACFPTLYEWEQKHRSILLAALKHRRQSSFSFQGGMETLPKAIGERLEGEVIFNQTARIEEHSDHVAIHLQSRTLYADRVISTIAPIDTIDHTSVAVVTLCYDKKVLEQRGFGYLVPRGNPIMGVIFSSDVFPEQNRSKEETRLTVMIGKAFLPDFENQDFKKIARQAIEEQLEIVTPPTSIALHIAKQAIPHLLPGPRIKPASSSRLVVTAPAFHGVSLQDCLAFAKKAPSL